MSLNSTKVTAPDTCIPVSPSTASAALAVNIGSARLPSPPRTFTAAAKPGIWLSRLQLLFSRLRQLVALGRVAHGPALRKKVVENSSEKSRADWLIG